MYNQEIMMPEISQSNIDPVLFTLQNGAISIFTFPGGARVFINGIDRTTAINPTLVRNLTPGPYNYRVSKIGYKDTIGVIDVMPGTTSNIEITLEVSPTIGTLDISSDPPGANIIIDDMITGFITRALISTIEQGSHTYKLSLKGYFDKTGSFNIIGRQTTIIIETLTPLPITTGNVHISSFPSGSLIFIDGIDQRKATPALVENLTPGEHNYRLTFEGYRDATGTFIINLGETSNLNVILEQILPTNGLVSITSFPPGSSIFIDDIDTFRMTPAVIGDLTPGSHSLRLIAPGHQDSISTFNIRSGHVTEVSIILVPITDIQNQITIGNVLLLGLILASGLTLMRFARR